MYCVPAPGQGRFFSLDGFPLICYNAFIGYKEALSHEKTAPEQ